MKRYHYIEITLLFSLLAAILILVSGSNRIPHTDNTVRTFSWTEGWYQLKDGEKQPVSRTDPIACTDGSLDLYYDITSNDLDGLTFSAKIDSYDPSVYLDGELIYRQTEVPPAVSESLRSKLYSDFTLPYELNGKTLCLSLNTGGVTEVELPDIMVGTANDIFLSHFLSESFVLLLAFTMLPLSLLAFLIFFLQYRIGLQDRRFLYIALYLMTTGVWCISETTAAAMMTHASSALATVSVYTFMLMTVPLLHFVSASGSMSKYSGIRIASLLFYVDALVQSILHIALHIPFSRMMLPTYILMAGSTILVLALLIKEVRATRNMELHILLVAFGALGVAAAISQMISRLRSIPYYNNILAAGYLIFILLLILALVENAISALQYRSESQVYERLSLEDRLTGIQNRKCFDLRVDSILSCADELSNVALIFLDVNGLRQVNDQFGRPSGDQLVLAVADCAASAFGKENCYRIVGTEFAVILENPNEIQKLLNTWNSAVAAYNTRHHISILASIGCSMLRDENGQIKTISDWKYEADQDLRRNTAKFSSHYSH